MSDHLDDFLVGKIADEAEAPVEELAPTEPVAAEPDAEPEAEAAEAPEPTPAPTTATPEEQGRVAAIIAERRQKQDWKEQSIRHEEQFKAEKIRADALAAEIAAFRTAPVVQQPVQQSHTLPNPVEDPHGYAQALQHEYHQIAFNERLQISQAMYEQANPGTDIAGMAERFKAEVAKDPRLGQQLRQQPHPYKYVAEHIARVDAFAAIGDPLTYREKIAAEIRAEMAAATGIAPVSQAAPRTLAALPTSLATARSASPRLGAQSGQDADEFGSMFPKR